jgi:threonine aldolase
LVVLKKQTFIVFPNNPEKLMNKIVDMRSDTVTRPSLQMRQLMAKAEVGDDVFGDDPTVKLLEEKTASILGKEAALYVPSGTMANQISLRALCSPGDEVICERKSHIVNDEVAAAAAVSGIMLSPYDGLKGKLSPHQVQNAIRPANIHNPITKLIALENTHNRAGGTVLDLAYINEIGDIAKSHSLKYYLDGARLWNAAIALNVAPSQIAKPFDMVSVCFSKGLGAPIGSAVTGSRDLIEKARGIRKMFGGGMRQVGIIAAAALYALENNFERIKDDHVRAKRLALGLAEIKGIQIDPSEVLTNIVIFKINRPPAHFVELVAAHGVLLVEFGPDLVRAVTHLDIRDEDIDSALQAIAIATKES